MNIAAAVWLFIGGFVVGGFAGVLAMCIMQVADRLDPED